VNVKPIETQYKGYRFRSRLEARWAVFFDAAEIQWQYELEGFELPSGRYLPDFWIPAATTARPKGGYWIDIKPLAESESDKQVAADKLVELSRGTGCNSVMLCGDPGECHVYWFYAENDAWHMIDSRGRATLPQHEQQLIIMRHVVHLLKDSGADKVRDAIHASRSARFEFGESGQPK
jgi:hypothetical protein